MRGKTSTYIDDSHCGDEIQVAYERALQCESNLQYPDRGTKDLHLFQERTMDDEEDT